MLGRWLYVHSLTAVLFSVAFFQDCAFADSVHCGYFVRRLCATLEAEARAPTATADAMVAPAPTFSSPVAKIKSASSSSFIVPTAHVREPNSSPSSSSSNCLAPAPRRDRNAPCPLSELLVVIDASAPDKRALFVDTGVYTKNRLFRLYMSSKRDKGAWLTRAETNRFKTRTDAEFFLASMASNTTIPICYRIRDTAVPNGIGNEGDSSDDDDGNDVDGSGSFAEFAFTAARWAGTQFAVRNASAPAADQPPPLSEKPSSSPAASVNAPPQSGSASPVDPNCDRVSSPAARAAAPPRMFARPLTLLTAPPFDAIDARRMHFGSGGVGLDGGRASMETEDAWILQQARRHLGAGFMPSSALASSAASSTGEFSRDPASNSPFPELDRFMRDIVQRWGHQSGAIHERERGFLKSWRHFAASSVVCYHVGGSRFCANIGRAHKSNQIFFVADFQHGVVYQKCWDPQCRAFRSDPILIPQHMLDLMDPDFVGALMSIPLDEESLAAASAHARPSQLQAGQPVQQQGGATSASTETAEDIEAAMYALLDAYPDM
jgi:hypothetical protein